MDEEDEEDEEDKEDEEDDDEEEDEEMVLGSVDVLPPHAQGHEERARELKKRLSGAGAQLLNAALGPAGAAE